MSNEEQQSNEETTSSDAPILPDRSDFPDSFSITGREEWGASPPTHEAPFRKLPQVVHFVHTETPQLCKDHESCSKDLRELQKKHMEKGLADINFNFLVGAGGRIYEGRGWKTDVQLPRKLREIQGQCLLIAYMGNYTYEMPPFDIMVSAFNLLVQGINNKLISPFFDFNHMLLK